jgi:uncharacterized lipoprotein YddW (UPF0748 family)
MVFPAAIRWLCRGAGARRSRFPAQPRSCAPLPTDRRRCSPGRPRRAPILREVSAAAGARRPPALPLARSRGLPLALAGALLAASCGEPAPRAAGDRALACLDPGAAVRAAGEPEPIRRGLWVLAEGEERVLEEPARVDALVERAAALGVTDLFVQVYRGGRSWYPSRYADATPHREIVARTGEDTLRRLLDTAHGRSLRVHAWFNALALHENRAAPLLDVLGRDAVLVDRSGRSLLDYPGFDVPEPDHAFARMETPALWLDPAVPAVIEYLEGAVDDLRRAAPDFDGLHLDFIRYPFTLPIVPGSRFEVGLDFGYGEIARTRFQTATGQPFERGERWDAFRREQVSELVRRLRQRLPDRWEVSAAVLGWADRAYTAALQDWRGWLESGALDFAVAMTYTLDDTLLRYWSRGLRCGVGGERVWLGLGSWLFAQAPGRAARQIAIAETVQPAGVALFSYDALAQVSGALEALPWRRAP